MRRWALGRGVAACLIAMLALPGCASGGGQPQRFTPVTISSPDLIGIGLVSIAYAKGFFRDQGLRVRLSSFQTGAVAVESMLRGHADFAVASETPEVKVILAGHRLAVVTNLVHSDDALAIVARRDHGISSLGDLRSKRLGVAIGTLADYFAYLSLTTAGVPARDVTRVNLTTGSNPAALLSGKVDAVSTAEPQVQQLASMLGARGITFSEPGLYIASNNLVTTPWYAASHPGVVMDVVRGLAAAQAFTEQHPQEAEALLSHILGLRPGLVSRLWPTLDFRIGLDQVLLTNMERQAAWMMSTRQVKARTIPDFLQDIDPSALRGVAPASITMAGLRAGAAPAGTP